ncbi:ras-related protein Rab-20 [Corythoichthys intestinalis]|uniref:ras-related protein Rab-20 n=1 Tax=Corythoichthys intestinalis TaxID=161448 RepID=UPI0025A4E3C9|nr:ras-related protein Rab-20 [Corythoichthys intestinalis]XP_061799678.1 ras-related protein Rab-20-like [Nerophis lumbriciformis]
MPESSKMRKPDVKVVLLGDMNVGKTSLLHRYTERKFKDTVSTVGGAFFLKQWGPYNVSIWDTAGREQFHGLGSMYCRGAAAVILTYDVTNWHSLAELEERFLSLTDTANPDCIYAVVGNKADLTDTDARLPPDMREKDQTESEDVPSACPSSPASPVYVPAVTFPKQVTREDALAFYGRILRYKGSDERTSLPAEKMCFETSAKTGYNVDALFEALFDFVLPSILRKRNEELESATVDLEVCRGSGSKRVRSRCC